MRLNRQQQRSALAIVAIRCIPIVVNPNPTFDIVIVVVALLVLNDAREPVGVGSQRVHEPLQLVPSLFFLRFFSLLTLPRPRCLLTLPVAVVIVHCYVVV